MEIKNNTHSGNSDEHDLYTKTNKNETSRKLRHDLQREVAVYQQGS